MGRGARGAGELMLGRLNHIAIVVPDIEAARILYQEGLGADVSPVEDFGEHGVRVVFINLSNSKIELLTPLGENSPIASFLQKNPAGGLHHICLEVSNVAEAMKKASKAGIRLLGDGIPKVGAHGKPVIFIHPKDVHGTLVELEEA